MNKEPSSEQKKDDFIIIEMDDVDEAINSTNTTELIPSQIDSTHPFDKEAFLEFIRKNFTHFDGDLRNANRPKTSDNPDDLESWEAEQILRRKSKKDWEENLMYLARFLYEEFFSVNQDPASSNPNEFQGVLGLTPGGLISHFFTGTRINGFDINAVLTLKPEGDNIKQAISFLKQEGENHSEYLGLIDVALEITWPITMGDERSSFRTMFKNGVRRQIMKDDGSYPEELDSVGYRLIHMLSLNPEMMEEIKDEGLKELVEWNYKLPLFKVNFLTRFWSQCSSVLLDENGVFKNPKGSDSEKILKTIEKMLIARTHPEMQIFFKYLSPSGYINNKK